MSARGFERRARELGAIREYEADSAGRIYAVYENSEVLPIGLTLPSLRGKSHIAPGGLDEAIRAARAALALKHCSYHGIYVEGCSRCAYAGRVVEVGNVYSHASAVQRRRL